MDPPSSLSQLSFQCPSCERSFPTPRSLGGHKRGHTLRARQDAAASDPVASPIQLNGSNQLVLPSVEASIPHDPVTTPDAISADNTTDTSTPLLAEPVQQLVLPSVETSTSADTDTAPAVIPTDTSPTLLVDSAHVHQPDSTASASSLTQDPDEYPPVIDSIRVTDLTYRVYLPDFSIVNLIPTQVRYL